MSDMEWEDLNPIVKTVPWAKAWVTVIKDGKPRLNLTFSEPTMKDCGYPQKANVMVGTKDGKTMIRLVWTEGGKFTVKKLELGGGRIHGIPCKAPVPDGARESESCEVEVKTAAEAVFILPLPAWEAQLNKPVVRRVEPPAQSTPVTSVVGKPAAPAPRLGGNAHTSTRKVNAADYLANRKVKVQRLAGDWWMLNNVRVPTATILIEVNKFRAAAELGPLTADQIE